MRKDIAVSIAIILLLVIGTVVWATVVHKYIGVTAQPTTTNVTTAPVTDGNTATTGNDAATTGDEGKREMGEPIASADDNIRVTTPQKEQNIGRTHTVIVGEGRAFENVVNWRIKDADGNVLASGSAYAHATDAGQYGAFVVYPVYTAMAGTKGTVEVYIASARDGSDQSVVSIPVHFVDEVVAQAFFRKGASTDCAQVTEAAVLIPAGASRLEKFENVIWQLLSGPTPAASAAGFRTSIPSDVRLLSLRYSTNTKTVVVDFSSELGVTDSCTATAITAKITQTLEQFSVVEHVIITINGAAPNPIP